MTIKNICVIDGHPDPDPDCFVHALCEEYIEAAKRNGYQVEVIKIADVQPTPLCSREGINLDPSQAICSERKKISNADHVMLAFPLWLGSMPSSTRAFFEQAACGGFFIQQPDGDAKWPKKMMKGKSARIILTMGMPAFAYRALMGSASLKAIERGVFGFSGFKPIKHTILGGVDSVSDAKRAEWLENVRVLGSKAI